MERCLGPLFRRRPSRVWAGHRNNPRGQTMEIRTLARRGLVRGRQTSMDSPVARIYRRRHRPAA
jgi:hypothetical protein